MQFLVPQQNTIQMISVLLHRHQPTIYVVELLLVSIATLLSPIANLLYTTTNLLLIPFDLYQFAILFFARFPFYSRSLSNHTPMPFPTTSMLIRMILLHSISILLLLN